MRVNHSNVELGSADTAFPHHSDATMVKWVTEVISPEG